MRPCSNSPRGQGAHSAWVGTLGDAVSHLSLGDAVSHLTLGDAVCSPFTPDGARLCRRKQTCLVSVFFKNSLSSASVAKTTAFARMPARLIDCLPVCMSDCLPVCLPDCLPVCLSPFSAAPLFTFSVSHHLKALGSRPAPGPALSSVSPLSPLSSPASPRPRRPPSPVFSSSGAYASSCACA
jgi:hypothetical protein